MIKVSIIVPVYNSERYLNDCFDSIIRQDLKQEEFEVIVINDGSTDNSLAIINEYRSRFVNFIVHSQHNHGLSVARNKGVELARGKYIFFLDSDDWIADNCLSTICEKCINENLDILRVVAANIIDGEPVKRYILNTSSSPLKGLDIFNKETEVCAPFTIYNRTFLLDNSLSFYPGIFHEDGEFTPRVYYFAKRAGSLNLVCYFVRQTPNSITRKVNIKKPFDIIVVAKSLHVFSLNMGRKELTLFSYRIAHALNFAFFQMQNMDADSIKSFNEEMYKNAYLYRHYLHSSTLKYQIQGLLLYLFPKSPVKVYRLLRNIIK